MFSAKGPAPADMQPVEKTRNKKDKGSPSRGNKSAPDQQNSHESDSFYKMYNKEIKVNQDEIPIILAELTDAAYNFIQRENYEKALILLQKTEGVLEVVSLEGCTRDKYISFITYNNMAMCFQKLGMLEECIIYLKGSIQQISDEKFYKKRRLAKRSRRLRQECKLKLQLCAIMSQTQNHSEALDNARKSVKLAHQMFKDLEELSQVYIDKINFKENLQAAQEQSDLEEDERDHIIQLILDSSPAKKLPKTFLDQSISLAERLSIKMCPVIKEVRKRLVGAPNIVKKGDDADFEKVLLPKDADVNLSAAAIKAIGVDTSAIETSVPKEHKPYEDQEEDDDDFEDEKPDMRSVLGFLNQNEWIFNLNIGNIMQIQPITMKDLLSETNDELELGREVFLENLSILTVAYFCMSTEMRFLLQSRANFLKPDVKRDRELESEYWHAKALEIACTFLPSECPLLNHVLLSYQKHHDPSLQPIKEDEESQDVLQVLRPLKGIENSKYQPIIRNLPNLKVSLSPTQYKPLLLDVDEFELFAREKPQFYQPMVVPTELEQLRQDFVDHLPATKSIEQVIEQSDSTEVPNLMHKLKSPILEVNEADSAKIISAQDIVLEGLNDHAIKDDKLHNVRMNSDQLNPIEWDLPKSGVDSPESYTKLKDGGMQAQISKIHQEMGTMSLSQENNQNTHSIEELLKKQILEGEDSPDKQNKKSTFNSQDESLMRGDPLSAEDTVDSHMYDKIIQKIIDNPKIDKRTLMQRFIAKIEMESNNVGGIAEELNQIKKFVSGLHNVGKHDAKLLNETLNADEQFYSEDDEPHHFNPMGSIGEDRGAVNQSADQIQVPQESSGVFHIGLSKLVQVSSNVPHSNNLQAARTRSGKRQQSSAKTQAPKKVQDVKDKRKPSAQLRPQVFADANKQTQRVPNHNLSHHDASTGQTLSNELNGSKRRPGLRRDNKISQSALEHDSLFKDIERSSEYVGANSAVSDKHGKRDFESSELNQESSKSPSTRYGKHDKQVSKAPGDNRNSSERKLSSQSRPNSSSLTHPTRASSAFLKNKKRNTLLANQATTQPIKPQPKKQEATKSRSSSSAKRQKQLIQNQQRLDTLKVPGKENQQSNQIGRKLSQSKKAHRKKPSNQQEIKRPASSMMLCKPNHNTSQQSHNFEIDRQNLHMKTLQKGKRHNFSQTKFVSKPKDLGLHRRRNAAKHVSASKSSGKKRSNNSGSTKKSKSKSLASGSEQNRLLQNELAQHSFDMIPDANFRKNQTTKDVRRNNPNNHSLVELQRQVLENQKMLIGMLNKQRSASGESSNQPSGDGVKRKVGRHESSQPQIKAKSTLLQAQGDRHKQSESQIIDLGRQFHSQSTLARNKRKQANQNSISQQVPGLSKIIAPAAIAPHTQTAVDNQRRMNKTLMYLRQLQTGGGKRTSEQGDMQNLLNEVNYLKAKMQEQFLAQQKESPARNNSNSMRRSGDRERKRSNSRSPSQPTKAKIPKQKHFEKMSSQGQFMGSSQPLGKGFQSASVNQILNCSAEDIAKLIVPTEFDSKQPVRAFNAILPQRVLLKAKNTHARSKAVPGMYEAKDGMPDESHESGKQVRLLKRQAEQFLGQFGPMAGEQSQHSLSMFDSELDLSHNKRGGVHHQLSQHEAMRQHFQSSKGEGLTPKNERLRGNFATNPNHSMSLQQPEGKHLSQTRRAVSKKVLKKAFDRQSATQSVLQQQKLMTAQNAVKQLIR